MTRRLGSSRVVYGEAAKSRLFGSEYIERHLGVFVGSGGETLIVKFQETEESGAKGTSVIAETKKGFVGRAGQKSWSNAVLDETERILKEEKQ